MKIKSLAPILLAACAGPTLAQPPVRVILDMDATTPGIQDSITVPQGTTVVRGLAVYIYDPAPSPRSIRGIGYLGGLDRGLAIGHQPSNQHTGSITSFTGHDGTPIVPDSTHYLTNLVQKAFAGPELHYLESGSTLSPIPSAPTNPVFRIDVHLSGTGSGDVFRIFLLDMVSVWSGGGAFSALPSGFGLDTGGDCVPDGTVTVEGIDPDAPVPVPPAAFLVDYIDSQSPASGGGGRIIIGPAACYPNCDNSTTAPLLTANDFACFLNRFVAGNSYANCDGSSGSPILTANDFVCFLNRFTAGCE